MLILTEKATNAIQTLAIRAETPDTAGLRITSAGDGSERLTVAPVSNPESGDQVVESEGARVFLEEGAAVMLDDKVLDARIDAQGAMRFSVAPQ